MATTVTLKPNAIDLSGSTSGTTTLQATAVAGTTTITLPAATDTLVGKATTDTLTNKTLTTPVISTISNTGTITLPTSTDTLVGRATTDTLTNKTLTSPTLTTPALGTPASGVMTNVTGINYDGYKNRIINSAMVIDQRNAGASVTNTTSNLYITDRWNIYGQQASKFTAQQNAGAVTPPAGFTYYLGMTSSSAYAVLSGDNFKVLQPIEGYNIADLGWGAAGASTVTLSFWVRSSLTGTFGRSFTNSSYNRSYPFTYTISVANTWEYKSVTIAGDTSGTWLTTNGIGVNVIFSMGMGTTQSGPANAWAGANYQSATGATSVVGTNGATFYITGVQLEKGSTATSFDYRPYGTELALCQRYYSTSIQSGSTITTFPAFSTGSPAATFFANVNSANDLFGTLQLPVAMRSAPTFNIYSATNRTSGSVRDATTGTDVAVTNYSFSADNNKGIGYMSGLSGTVSRPYNFQWTSSAEL
jgi:hypothetical protein